jgi:hypothetical protein
VIKPSTVRPVSRVARHGLELEAVVFTLGALLVLAAAALTADIILESRGTTRVTVVGHHLSFADWRLFVFGVITGVVVVLALRLVTVGFARDRRRRRAARGAARAAPSTPSEPDVDTTATRPRDRVVARRGG